MALCNGLSLQPFCPRTPGGGCECDRVDAFCVLPALDVLKAAASSEPTDEAVRLCTVLADMNRATFDTLG